MALDDKQPYDPAPTYEEAVGHTAGPSLTHAERIRNVRASRIAHLLSDFVDPLVEQQVQAGLTKSTFLVVPSDVTQLQSTSQAGASRLIEKVPGVLDTSDSQDQILGFPDDELVKLIRLEGASENSNFWHQQVLVAELEMSLRERMGIGHHADLPPRVSPNSRSEKRGFWRKKSSEPSSPWNDAGRSSLAATSRPNPNAQLGPGEMAAYVSVEEISVRTESSFGLQEVNNGRALAIRIRVGA